VLIAKRKEEADFRSNASAVVGDIPRARRHKESKIF